MNSKFFNKEAAQKRFIIFYHLSVIYFYSIHTNLSKNVVDGLETTLKTEFPLTQTLSRFLFHLNNTDIIWRHIISNFLKKRRRKFGSCVTIFNPNSKWKYASSRITTTV